MGMGKLGIRRRRRAALLKKTPAVDLDQARAAGIITLRPQVMGGFLQGKANQGANGVRPRRGQAKFREGRGHGCHDRALAIHQGAITIENDQAQGRGGLP